MCRRNTPDPLLSIVSRDEFTLLRNMRTGVKPLSTWVNFKEKGPFEPVGQLNTLIVGDLPKFTVTCRDRADIAAQKTAVLNADIGLKFLAGFFSVVGLPALTKLKTRIAGMHKAHLRIRIDGVQECGVDLGKVSQALGSTRIGPEQGKLITDGRTIAFASAVLTARSVSVQTVTQAGADLELGAGVVAVADLDTGASTKSESTSEISFTGTTPVTLGVRLYELVVDAERRALRFNRAPGWDVLSEEEKAVSRPDALYVDGIGGDLSADL